MLPCDGEGVKMFQFSVQGVMLLVWVWMWGLPEIDEVRTRIGLKLQVGELIAKLLWQVTHDADLYVGS
jgi:hypothetical protein